MHPNQITDWKNQLVAQSAAVFEGGKPAELAVDVKAAARQGRAVAAGKRFLRVQQGWRVRREMSLAGVIVRVP